MLPLENTDACVYVPDQTPTEEALARTTHMCIAAHQDDIEIFAYHGISECYHSAEKWFTGVVMTNGAGSPRTGKYATFDDSRMQELRLKEQNRAAEIGEYSAQIQLGYSSAELKDPSITSAIKDLRRLLESAQPEILYVHNPADKHDTHVACLMKTLDAIRSLPLEKRPCRLLAGEVWRGLDWLMESPLKVALPVNLYPELAKELLETFDSQISAGKRYDLATIGRRLANATFSESHETDAVSHITWALDLSSLLAEGAPNLETFLLSQVDALKTDIKKRLRRLY